MNLYQGFRYLTLAGFVSALVVSSVVCTVELSNPPLPSNGTLGTAASQLTPAPTSGPVTPIPTIAADDFSGVVRAVVQQVRPAVVQITNQQVEDGATSNST